MAQKNKRDLLLNIELSEQLLQEIKKEFLTKTKDKNGDDAKYLLNYNSSLINRNRIIINQKLKELEKY